MEIQEINSKETRKRKQACRPNRIQIIKFAIGIVIGITIYLILKLIF